MSIEHALVTGAAGFFGRHLVAQLLQQGCRVRALVRNTPLEMEHPNLECFAGDVQDAAAMHRACEGVDTVFHTAAWIALLGGSAASEDYRARAYAINVDGARNLIEACREQQVSRLVHTSSVDVCFDGIEDLHMDENTPYATTFNCLYTETKIAAEKAILAANGSGGLLTCAIRPDGIWGNGSLMMEELVDKLLTGKMPVRVAGMGAVHDHVHVDNLVHAHLLAAEALVPGHPACGKAYFVSDGHPAAFFEFVRPFVEGMGYQLPRFSIPAKPIYLTMKALEWAHFRLGLPEPLLTPHELNKATVSHVVSSAAAERDFNYRPIKTVEEGMDETVAYYRDKQGLAP